MSDIDQRFRAERLQRQIAERREAERQANHERYVQRIRAEYSTPAKIIRIDGPIGAGPGEVSARWFRSQLPTDGSPIEVRFHSEGGSVFEAFAIYDLISAYPGRKKARVEAMAFSAASLLLCAFGDVEITPNGYTMLHAPYSESKEVSAGESELLAGLRQRLINLYSQKTRKPVSVISRLVDQETFFDAEASLSLGIVNRVLPVGAGVVARLPQRIVARMKAAALPAKQQWQIAVDEAAKTMPRNKAVASVDKSHPGLRQKMIDETNKR